VTTEFSELYGQFAGRVLAYARRHTNRDDAEDVVAETFHVAWRRRDVMPEEALPWLLGVAHNVMRSQWRNSRRTTPTDTLERLADVAGDSLDVGVVRRQELVELLSKLPDHEREALLLVAWDDLSADQAAQVLGISAGAVRVRIHRARKRLQAVKEALDA
jgi:RNA polymerase sigma-70 factor (ECF subfamily)